MAESKQAQLAAALATVVRDTIVPEFKADFKDGATAMAKLTVTVNAILARLEIIEAVKPATGANGAAVAAKRSVRPGTGAKKAAAGGAPSAPAKGGKKGGKSDVPTLANALLYFRHAMKENWDDCRQAYAPAEVLETAQTDASVSKFDPEKDEEKFWSAAAAVIWRDLLTEQQKGQLRSAQKAWTAKQERASAPPPLEEDVAGEAGGDGGDDGGDADLDAGAADVDGEEAL